MIGGVIARFGRLRGPAADDAPRAAALHAGRADRVLVIVPARVRRQQPFAVAEDDAVTLVTEWPAAADLRVDSRASGGRSARAIGGGASAAVRADAPVMPTSAARSSDRTSSARRGKGNAGMSAV